MWLLGEQVGGWLGGKAIGESSDLFKKPFDLMLFYPRYELVILCKLNTEKIITFFPNLKPNFILDYRFTLSIGDFMQIKHRQTNLIFFTL